MSKTVLIPVMIALLAGCEAGKQERQSRIDDQRRDQAQVERTRREFWQGLACFAGAWSVVLLIVGVAMGSATIRKVNGGPDASNP